MAAFDAESNKVGTEVFGVGVSPLSEMPKLVRERRVDIGIIATPPDAAQEAARQLAEAGVGAILNFAPVELTTMDHVRVRTMDVVLELEGLSCLLATEGRGNAVHTRS